MADNAKDNSNQNRHNDYSLDEDAIRDSIERTQPKKSGPLKFIFLDFGRKTHYQSIKLNFKPHLSNFLAFLSPTCPKCGSSILMRDHRIPFSYKDNVLWFCGGSRCDYSIVAPNNFKKLKQAIVPSAYSLARDKWLNLSEDEKLKNIANHYLYAKIYLVFFLIIFVYALYHAFASSFFVFMHVFSFSLFIFLLSITRAYRAWQMRTGLIFMKNSPFLAWFKYAPSRYSLEWWDGVNPLPVEVLDKLEVFYSDDDLGHKHTVVNDTNQEDGIQ